MCATKDINIVAWRVLSPEINITSMVEQIDHSGLGTPDLSQREVGTVFASAQGIQIRGAEKYKNDYFSARSGQGFFDQRDLGLANYLQATHVLSTAVVEPLGWKRSNGLLPAVV